MGVRFFVFCSVVAACVAVPAAVIGVSSHRAWRQDVDGQIDRGQQLASTAATLHAVARQSGSAADAAVLAQFLRAVVADDVQFVVVTVGEDVAAGEAAPGLAAQGLGALLGPPAAGVVVVDASVVERDRQTQQQTSVGRVVVGLRRAPVPVRTIVGFCFTGLCAAVVVSFFLLRALDRRVIRPVQHVADALTKVAAGQTIPPVETPGDAAEVRALVDGYHALVKALADKQSLQTSLSRTVGAQVADDLAFLDAPPKMALVSVLFVDVRDFTPLTAALTPDQTIAFLDKLLTGWVEIVHRHGGHVERFLADGLVAVWGAPKPALDHAARAVAAAVDIERRAQVLQRRAQEDGLPNFVIGVGVASGLSVTGGVGPQNRRTFAVVGEVSQAARRIQQEAKAQGLTVLVTEETFTHAKDHVVDVKWKKTPPMVVRGIGMPLELYRPQRVDPQEQATDRIQRSQKKAEQEKS